MRRFLSKLSRSNVKAEEPEDGERRRNNRRPIDAPVVVEIDSIRHECRLSDVGPGGALLKPGFAVAVGRQVTVSIPDTRITVAAEVRRVDDGGVGIAFDEETAGAMIAGWSRGLFR